MRKPWDTVKLKILLGYFFLAGIAAFTVWLIYSEILVYTDNESRMSRLNNKMLYFNSVLTNLYQAEALERSYSQTGLTIHYNNYKKLMDSIYMQFDTLSRLSNDPLEKMHTDSIRILLDQKRQNLRELSLLKKNSSEDMYERVMNRFNINKDSINALLNIRTIITDKSESTFVEQKKRNFFERLRYAFNPKDPPDSIIQVNKQQTVQTDTIVNEFNPADSVIEFLTAIMNDIRKENINSELQMARKQRDALANDRTITLQLRQMLSHFEKEIFLNSLQELNTLQNRIRVTSWYLIALGGLALIIIVLFIALILKDITRSQKYRTELEKAKAYSDTLLKSKEQIMLSITHDIKSPLASVMGYARLMNETDNKESRKLYLASINKSGDHILKLINDLVDHTRLETGKLKFNYSGFNLYELTNEAFMGFYPVASSKNLEFTLHYNLPQYLSYYSDPVRIKQILGNIISNAIKYTQQGSITVYADRIVEDAARDIVVFKISDTGIGISEENSRIIFNEFTRVSDKYDGAGLGLSIAHRIVTFLKGSIILQSKPGEGSSFIVRLPLEKLPPAKTSDVESLHTQKNENYNLLVIDDDEVFLGMSAELLENAGFRVTRCNSPLEAVQLLENLKPDLIITDMQMPAMNGVDLLAYLQRRSGKMIPVILLSGTDTPISEEVIFSAVLKKPVNPDELFQSIHSILGGQRSDDITKKVAAHENRKEKQHLFSYNLDQIRQFSLDDHESIQRILLSFAESSYENLILFDHYIKEHDRNSLSELAHKMMAMFRQLEAESIVELLNKLERNFNSMSDEQWVHFSRETLKKVGQFIEIFCEEQRIVV